MFPLFFLLCYRVYKNCQNWLLLILIISFIWILSSNRIKICSLVFKVALSWRILCRFPIVVHVSIVDKCVHFPGNIKLNIYSHILSLITISNILLNMNSLETWSQWSWYMNIHVHIRLYSYFWLQCILIDGFHPCFMS